jgi:phosphoethanolamine N-methyltransferase
MPDSETENRYDQSNIDSLEIVYGNGYLSAGGDTEVAKNLHGVDLAGKQVLDLGCGLGGASVSMVRDLGATDIVAFDIDETVLARADLLVKDNNVDDRVKLVKGVPGPLEFASETFDLAYVTAVACHMSDLIGFFDEIARVLKPGGWLTGSDWMLREKNEAFHVWDNLLRDHGLNFYFVDQTAFENALDSSGFSSICFSDRTEAFTRFAAISRQRVEGELQASLQSSLGDEGYRAFIDWTQVRYDGLNNGAMWYQQFRGQKIV